MNTPSRALRPRTTNVDYANSGLGRTPSRKPSLGGSRAGSRAGSVAPADSIPTPALSDGSDSDASSTNTAFRCTPGSPTLLRTEDIFQVKAEPGTVGQGEPDHVVTTLFDKLVALLSMMINVVTLPFRALKDHSSLLRSALLFFTLAAFAVSVYQKAPAAAMSSAFRTFTGLSEGELSRLSMGELLRQGARADENKAKLLERISADKPMSDAQFERLMGGYNAWEAYSDKIEAQFARLEQEQGKHGASLASLDGKVVGLQERIGKGHTNLERLDDQVEQIRDSFDEQRSAVTSLEERYNALDIRLTQVQQSEGSFQQVTLDGDAQELRDKMIALYQDMEERLADFDYLSQSSLSKLEGRLSYEDDAWKEDLQTLKRTLDGHSTELESLRTQVTNVQDETHATHAENARAITEAQERHNKALQDYSAEDEKRSRELRIVRDQLADLEVLKGQLHDKLQAISSEDNAHELPDFALESAGGRIVHKLTSETYEISYGQPILDRLGFRKARGKRPTVAIQTDTNPGSCWPMKGTFGQLGISLVQPIIPTAITLEHPAKAIWTGQTEGRSAPRDFEVWGVYDADRFPIDIPPMHVDRRQPAAAVLLLSGIYDPVDPLRTYRVSQEAQELVQEMADIHHRGVPTVVFRVLDNWGHPTWTCIYRVQVHGEPLPAR